MVASISTVEAEYYALVSEIQEGCWLISLMKEIGMEIQEPITLFDDNQGCIAPPSIKTYLTSHRSSILFARPPISIYVTCQIMYLVHIQYSIQNTLRGLLVLNMLQIGSTISFQRDGPS